MKTISTLALFAAFQYEVYSSDYDFGSSADLPNFQSSFQSVVQGPCQISRHEAYSTLQSSEVPILASSNSPLSPRIPAMNSTTGEQWEFDATSSSGDSGILIAFYRDPEFAFLGAGNLRINADTVWPDGTKTSLVDYAAQSIIEDCEGDITGTWMKPGSTWKFAVDRKLRRAQLMFDTPRIKGIINMASISKPRFADGAEWPATNFSERNVPGMFWFEPIPAARASVDLEIDGHHMVWSGMGGAERIWQGRTWFEILRGYGFLRASVGTYTMSYWTATSKPEPNITSGNLLLAEQGIKVFSSSHRIMDTTQEPPDTDYFTYTPTYGGSVRGGLKNSLATGYDLVMVSPKKKSRWSFHFEHKTVQFEFNLGGGAGGTAFIGKAKGGKMSEAPSEGVFLNEDVDFTNLSLPGVVVTTLYWYHRSKHWSILKAEALMDTIKAYSQ